MKSIHIPKLVQQIKKATKTKLIWQHTAEAEYITNGHWLVKVESTAGTKVRSALFEVFGREAQIGQSLYISYGSKSDKGPSCERMHNVSNAKFFGRLTPVVILGEGKEPSQRLVVIGEHLLAINNEYAEMIADETAAGTGPRDPIYFGQNGELLILPIHLEEGWRDKLDSLIGAR